MGMDVLNFMRSAFSTASNSTAHLVLDESCVLVVPATRDLEKLLTFTEKVMEKEEGKRGQKVVKRQVPMYTKHALPENPKLHALQAPQGFWLKIQKHLEAQGVRVTVTDVRLKFPEPDFSRIHGLRFSQEPLLKEALYKKFSGLIGAPTRFGKSSLLLNTLRAYPGLKTVVTLPGVDLIEQLHAELEKSLPERDVQLLHGGSRKRTQGPDITVVSMDSLDKCDHAGTRLVLIDEPHALVTDGRMPDFTKFERARKIGFGATLEGRFDNRDPLIEGLIGPVLAERTYREAIAEGAIAPIVVYMLPLPVKGFYCYDRNAAYKKIMWENEVFARWIKWIAESLVPMEWQVMGFIQNEKQANYLQARMGNLIVEVAMAKLMTKNERKDMTDRLRSADTRFCLASNIYAQGVTFSKLRVVLNLSGGGASTGTIQKPGRVAELIAGKRCGVVFDFLFEAPADHSDDDMRGACWQPVWESKARKAYYEAKGFEVYVPRTQQQLVEMFRARCI
jgi:superfamily II DNA or RNA helicase